MILYVLLMTYCPFNCDIHDWRVISTSDQKTCERLQPLVERPEAGRFTRCMLRTRYLELKASEPE